MGPPLGHVRDPYKQSRFVEAELSALLQAAGGTLPVIKKDERGVYVIVEGGGEHSHAKPAAAKPAAPAAPPKEAAATPKPAPAPAAPAPTPAAPPKPAEHKAGAQPNRQLFKRSTYAGVTDTGPVPGETFEQKVARLKALSAAAKQRAEEGGGEVAPSAVPPTPAPAPTPEPVATSPAPASEAPPPAPAEAAPAPASATASPAEHKATGNANRSLMKRGTYCGVVDTGPVPGETFQQKVARLTALAAAAKQRAEGG